MPAIRDIIDDSCPLVNLKNGPEAAEAAAYIRKTATCGFGTCVLSFFCGNNDGGKDQERGALPLLIEVPICEDAQEPEVTITCRERTALVERLVAALRIIDRHHIIENDLPLSLMHDHPLQWHHTGNSKGKPVGNARL